MRHFAEQIAGRLRRPCSGRVSPGRGQIAGGGGDRSTVTRVSTRGTGRIESCADSCNGQASWSRRSAYGSSIRLLCTKVWPVLYQVLTLQQDDVIGVWCLPKEEAIELLPRNTPLSQTIRGFYQAVREYYPAENSVEGALLVIKSGVTFLKSAKSWRDETDL